MAVTESIALIIHIPRPGDAHPALSGRRPLDASTKGGFTVKRLSEQLSELSARTKRTEDVIDAARDRNLEWLHTQQAALASAVDAQRATLSEQAGQAQANAKSNWQKLRSAVDARFATIRANSAQHRADRNRVERRADAAEGDAVDAVEFALYALQEAGYAIVEAAIARADADDLVQQP